MPCLEWRDSHKLDISQLDDQHRHLFDLLNDAFDGCLDHRREHLVETMLEKLDTCAGHHFSVEEQYMREHGYPEHELHAKEHDLFVHQIVRLREDLLAGRGLMVMEMIQFLGAWLSDHIREADGKLAAYLADRGVS